MHTLPACFEGAGSAVLLSRPESWQPRRSRRPWGSFNRDRSACTHNTFLGSTLAPLFRTMAAAELIGLEPVQAAAGGGPLLDEEESVMATFERVQLVAAAQDLGEGTLFITEW